ncbi:obscurin [Melanotaenia boesemani]|uniref:obscurin n=1 Tax=Melanotaenia boesemani TaxID=1250792 RepID=UPI001C05ED07|nr:obscurin [Melanotaenia boesemani]
MSQPNSAAFTCAAEWKMLLLKIFAVIYLTAVCADTEADYVTQSNSQTSPAYEPPLPVLKLKSAHSDVFSSEKVELNCYVDGSSDWTVTWKKDGKELLSENGLVLTITAQTKHSGGYTCTGQHKTKLVSTVISNQIIVTVTDPPTPTLKLLSGWQDVFVTENVSLSCEVSSPEWTFTWYKDKNQLQKDSVLTINEKGTLFSITSVSQTHQGQYSCKAHLKSRGVDSEFSNTVDLKVYSSNPKPIVTRSPNFNQMYPGESINFKCTFSESTGWEYVWYHNGKDIPAPNNDAYTIASVGHSNSGDYHCKAKRGPDPFYTAASESITLQVSDPPTPTLKLLSGWQDVFVTEKVSLSCEVSSPEWTFTWYKDKKPLPKESVLTINEKGTLFSITSVSQTHQGQYSCKAHLKSRGVDSEFSNTVDLKVYSSNPKPIVTRSSNFNPMYPGESINFNCMCSESTGWEYVWYHKGKDIPAPNNGAYTIASVGHSNSGDYQCKAKRGPDPFNTAASETITLQVSDPPKPTLKLLSGWQDVFVTEKVSLSCEVSSPDWTFTWYKDKNQLQKDSVLTINEKGTLFNITSVSQTHQGQYACKAHLTSRGVNSEFSNMVNIKVYYPPKPTLKLLSGWQDVFVTENVSLSCEVSSPDWTFTWYKDKNQLQKDSVLTINEKGTLFNITSVSQTHQGQYSCKAHLTSRRVNSEFSNSVDLKVYSSNPKPIVTRSSNFNPMYPGESINFNCMCSESTGWEYVWYHKGKDIPAPNNGTYTIASVDHSNSGDYYCKAKRGPDPFYTATSETTSLQVSEIPVPLLKPLTQWLDVFPGESVKMSCEMKGSTGWAYTWRKDAEEIKAKNPVSFSANGHILSISHASSLHHGDYSCSGKLKGRSVTSNFSSEVTLDVYDTTPRVTLEQNPVDNLMHTDDFVSFSCHINVSSGWEYLWYKEDRPLSTSENNYNISSAVTRDSGSYKCQVKRGVSSVFTLQMSEAVILNIKERPQASITLQTGWSEAFSTDSLALKCNVTDSDHMWNFTWFRGNEKIDLPPSADHAVTPQNDPEQSYYTCQGIRNERPFYSKTSHDFRTKNLLLKRRILLSISGCLFFGIIAVFLGCIVLRIFRKPAENDEKFEEEDLFAKMVIKDSTDAPCPLVEYITDASIKAMPADVDENGTVCSETTPLPITSQEDQGLMTANHDSTENGGGLVSFQQ